MQEVGKSIPLAVAWLALGACASSGGDDELVTDAGTTPTPAEDGALPTVDAAPVPVCSAGQRVSCACDEGRIGLRSCVEGAWDECAECQAPATPGESLCVPGYYEGTASGTYRASSVFDGWITAFATDNDTRISFVLEKRGGNEFGTLGDACVQVRGDDPEAGGAAFWLSGEVDCATGLLEGEMRGYHRTTGSDGQPKKFFYKGKLVGRYDPDTQSFVDTGYAVVERPVLLGPPPGGEGTWSATLQQDASAPAGTEQTLAECLGEDFPADDEFDEVDL